MTTESNPRNREFLVADAIAHAARSPLSVIAGIASSLRETSTADTREGLDRIVRETQRLSRMLENRVIAVKLEAEVMVRREWVSLEELVGAALARLDATLAGRAVATTVDGELVAHIDPVLGELLLVNLIDNVVGHTPVGSPIEIFARRTGAVATIEVADRGAGLPPMTMRRLAEQTHVGASDARLGLAVCRSIAVAYGGAIEADSRVGGGTIVRITLPDGAPLPALDRGEEVS